MKFNPINTLLDFLFPKTETELGADNVSESVLNSKVAIHNIAEMYYVTTFFKYNDKTIKGLIWSLKYKNNRSVAKLFAKVMYPYILDDISDRVLFSNFENPLIIPIPISKKRKNERGFNQSELLATEIIKTDKGKTFELLNNVLFKTRNTDHQARTKDVRERKENIKDSFSIQNPELIKGGNIILIDDVITTGSTIKEARKILMRAGARKVIAFTIAH